MKHVNPVYDRLIDQLNIGVQVALVQEDFDSLILGFEFCTRIRQEDKEEIQNRIIGYVGTTNPSDHNILPFVLFLKAFPHRTDIISKWIGDVERIVRKLLNSQIYPVGRKALILHAIKEVDYLQEFSEEAFEYIVKFLSKESQEISDDVFADAVFALQGFNHEKASLKAVKIVESELQDRRQDGSILTTPKFGKILCYLHSIDLLPDHAIDLYEKRLSRELLSPRAPDLWFAISESDKIINSNLGGEINNHILDALQSGTSSWKNLIEEIRDGGVMISLGTGIEVLNFAVLDDYFNIYCLQSLGRDYSVQLTIAESEKFDVFKRMNPDQLIFDLPSVHVLLLSLIGIIAGVFLTLYLNGEEYLDYWKEFQVTKTNPKSPIAIIAYLANPFVIILILIWWYVNIYLRFKEKWKITWTDVIFVNPIIVRLRKFFN